MLYHILRFIGCLIITVIAAYPMVFVFILPEIISIKSLSIALAIFITFTMACYLLLNLRWLVDAEVTSNRTIKIAAYAITMMIVIGTLMTFGLGLIFTFPTIAMSIYLICWNNKKYNAYLVTLEEQKMIEEKARKYDAYQQDIKEYEAYQERLRLGLKDNEWI